MKIYHGTSERFLSEILKDGIKPRKKETGNWENFPSNEGMVYLSTTYPFYFANASIKKNEKIVVFEIELENLSERFLYPDEDFVSQILYKEQKRPLEDVQKDVIKNIHEYKSAWELSLLNFGNISYRGIIGPENIERYVLFDWKKRGKLHLDICDPTISIINFKLMSYYYQQMVKWFFGDEKKLPKHLGLKLRKQENESESITRLLDKAEKQIKVESKDRTGVEIIKIIKRRKNVTSRKKKNHSL